MTRLKLFGITLAISSLIFALCILNFPIREFVTSLKYQNSSSYIYKKTGNRKLIASCSNCPFPLEKYFENPDLLFENVEYLFKDAPEKKGIPVKVALIKIDGKQYVAKKYYPTNLSKLKCLLPIRSSKPYRSWYFAHFFEKLKIATPACLLLIEDKKGPFCVRGYTVHEYIDGVTAYVFFSPDSPYKNEWEQTLIEIHHLLKQLSKYKITHRSLHLDNIIIKDGKPALIDLDKTQHFFPLYPYKSLHKDKKDRNKFIEKFSETTESKNSALLNKTFQISSELCSSTH